MLIYKDTEMEIPSCVNQSKVTRVKSSAGFNVDVAGISSFFKLVGDENRLKILLGLNQFEMCVHELAQLLESNSSAVSHQLRKLKDAGLISSRKDGQVRYYSISDDRVKELLNHTNKLFQTEKTSPATV